MKTNPNDIITAHESNSLGHIGLTKREYFAAIAMGGLCVQAIPGSHNSLQAMISELPEKAVAMADALIKELNKE